MDKHFAVKTKEGNTFMTAEEIKQAPEGYIKDVKVPVLVVEKGSPSTEYNRPAIFLRKDNWQWGTETYYEIYNLKRDDGLILQMMEEIQHYQEYGYKVEFKGFLNVEEE